MKDSKRVPGYRFRPIDNQGLEQARKDNIKRYEVAGDDLARPVEETKRDTDS